MSSQNETKIQASLGKKYSYLYQSSSWKDKMLTFFSTKNCQYASQSLDAVLWLQQIMILIGVGKGGTKAIRWFLHHNPMFASRCSKEKGTREIFFFSNKSLQLDHIDQRDLQIQYANKLQLLCPLAVETLMKDVEKMYLDDTPTYMQDSHYIPQLINCGMPKAKVMAILRNPIDRAFSHYNYYLERNWCTELTFDEWVDINIRELSDAGVVGAADPYEELLAWKRYNDNRTNQALRKCRTFVTRGLYAIPILHFMTALEAAGRPKSDFHIVHSEKLNSDLRQEEYDKVISFLGLAPQTLLPGEAVHSSNYKTTLTETARLKLDFFFRPYNFRLYEMLDWDPVWNTELDSEKLGMKQIPIKN
jgi:hypothetical protein